MTRALAIFTACLVVAIGAELLSRAYHAASHGDLHVMQWGGER